MSETQFNTLCVVVFILAATGVVVGFTYFYKWYLRELKVKPSPAQLLRRQAELEARFRRCHPDVGDDGEPGA